MTTFERIRYLGGGHFGEVWLERDNALNRLCAAKYLRRLEFLGHRDFFLEAQAMALAEHDNVVQVYSADISDGIHIIRMEYLPAGSIEDRYAGTPVPVTAALTAIEDTCRGLEFLHSRHWLHRDIKPANLMFASNGRVKISDFGLSCDKSQVADAPLGYVCHLPPESIATTGYIDSVAGDVYSVGVTLYRLLNGSRRLYGSESAGVGDLSDLIRQGKFPRRDQFLPHVHDKLRRVVRKALNPDPHLRYNSASELRHAAEKSRPKVSWRQEDGGDRDSWHGESFDGRTMWRAEIAPTRFGRYSFRLERLTTGGVFRARRADGADFALRAEAIRHAMSVLGRVAEIGN